MKKKLIILLIIIGFAVYFNSLFNGFVWDDEEMILNNPTIKNLNIFTFFFEQNSTYYRPVMAVVNSSILILSRDNPFFFRLFQVGLHIGCSIMIYLIFSHFIKANKVIPFFLALIFLIHPINAEAVLFISATQEVLFVCAGLVGLWLIIRKESINLHDLLFAEILFAISLLIKETGVMFFFLTFFYLWLFQKNNIRWHILISGQIVFFYLLTRFLMKSTYVGSKGLFPIMQASVWERLMTIPKIVFFYLSKFFFPLNLKIARHWVVSRPDINNFYLPFFICSFLFLLAMVLIIRMKNRTLSFFFIWFILGLIPHLQLVPLNMTVAERWFYFSGIGLLGMIGIFLSSIKQKIFQKAMVVIGLIILCFFFARTVIRGNDWRNGLILFSHDSQSVGNSFDLENNLGVVLFREGKYDQAKKHFENSIRLSPGWWVNWNNLGAVYEKANNLNKAKEFYLKSLKNGDYYLAYENYVGILIKQKKYTEAKQFIEEKALRKFPYNQRINNAYNFLLTNPK